MEFKSARSLSRACTVNVIVGAKTWLQIRWLTFMALAPYGCLVISSGMAVKEFEAQCGSSSKLSWDESIVAEEGLIRVQPQTA
jgi:hypothetical protein